MHSLFAYGCILLIFISVVLLVLLFAKSKGSALSQFVQENEKEERRLELRNTQRGRTANRRQSSAKSFCWNCTMQLTARLAQSNVAK